MLRKDYILKMIEMLAELVAGILGLIKKGEYKKATERLNDAYLEYLKNDAQYFKKIPKDELTNKLLEEHNYTNDHLEILSELFFAEAENQFAQGNKKEGLNFYEKSLLLMEYIDKEAKTFSFDKQMKMDSIKEKIELLK